VFTRIRVKKSLREGQSYDKLYHLYRTTVTFSHRRAFSASSPRTSTWPSALLRMT